MKKLFLLYCSSLALFTGIQVAHAGPGIVIICTHYQTLETCMKAPRGICKWDTSTNPAHCDNSCAYYGTPQTCNSVANSQCGWDAHANPPRCDPGCKTHQTKNICLNDPKGCEWFDKINSCGKPCSQFQTELACLEFPGGCTWDGNKSLCK